MGNKGSQTTTSTNAPPAYYGNAYENLSQQALSLASQPYQPYTGQLTAPINQQQQGAINEANQLYPQVAGLIGSASQPLTAAQIQQYYSPFQQNVVDTTEAAFANTNAQQQQQVLGNAAAQGALGGNRTGVAQAALAGQQQTAEAPVLAGLENTGYNQAVQYAMQQFQQNPETAAGLLSSTGTNIANTQFGYGTVEQQTAQNQLNAQYQQYLAAQAYPFQANAYGVSEVGSLGSLAGGTGQVIAPPPSLAAQYGGLATAGVGAYALSDRRLKEDVHKVGETNDGQPIYRFRFKGSPQWHIGLMAQDVEKKHPDAVGRAGDYKTVDIKGATDAAVKRRVGGLVPDFAGGGAPLMPYSGGPSYIPAMQAVHGSGPPHPQNAPSYDTGTNQILQNAQKMAGTIKSGNALTPGQPATFADETQDYLQDLGEAAGGRVMRYGGLVLPARNRIEYKRGGPIRAGLGFSSFVPRRGYQYGGSPEELAAEGVPASFDERFPTQPGLAPADFDARFQGQASPPDLDGGTIMQPSLEPPTVAPAPPPMYGPIQTAGVGQEEAPEIVTRGPEAVSRGRAMWEAKARRAAEAEGVDPDIYAGIIHQESGFNPNVGRSSAGAQGIAQFMPKTAEEMGIDPRNPDQSLQGGARYLKKLLVQFNGDYPKAIAAYNAGPGRVASGAPLPAETQAYVPAVMAFAGQGAQGAGETAGLGADEGGYTPPPPRGRTGGLATGDTPPSSGGFGFGFNPDLGQALMAAGFGMAAAGARPGATFAGSVGQGGLTGLGAYGSLQREHLAEARLSSETAKRDVETEAARENLQALRKLRGGDDTSAATPKSGLVPVLPSSGPQAALSNAQTSVSKVAEIRQTPQGPVGVDRAGRPVVNPNALLAQAQRYMASGVPAYQSAGEKMMSLYETMISKGVGTDAAGNVIPLPGAAEAEARAAGMKKGATAPYDIMESAVREGARPYGVKPNEVVTTGAQVDPALQAAEQWAIQNMPGSGGGAPAASAMPPGTAAPTGQSPWSPRLIRNPDGSLASTVTPATEAMQKDAANRYEKAGDAYTAAQDIKMRLGIMEKDAEVLNSTGWSTTGAGANARLNLAKSVNTIATNMGLPAPIDPKTVGSWESLNKQTTQMGFELARSLGSREAMMIVQQATSSVPNAENTPVGFRLVGNAIRQQVQRQADYYEFATNYMRTHGGDTIGAEIAFNKAHPPTEYSQRAIANGIVDPRDKQALLANRNNPAALAKFDKLYPGMANTLLSEPPQ